jgi:hypothetical protein
MSKKVLSETGKVNDNVIVDNLLELLKYLTEEERPKVKKQIDQLKKKLALIDTAVNIGLPTMEEAFKIHGEICTHFLSCEFLPDEEREFLSEAKDMLEEREITYLGEELEPIKRVVMEEMEKQSGNPKLKEKIDQARKQAEEER